MRLWRSDQRRLLIAAGSDPGWSLDVPAGAGLISTPGGQAWLEPIRGPGVWLELAALDATSGEESRLRQAAPRVLSLVSALLESERQRAYVAEELAGRYEEIELLYAISEILGRTLRLEEAAQIIVREVSAVVGARRASIMVFDETSGTLRTVAARGFAPEGLVPVAVEDDCSIAARVFRERRTVTFDPSDPDSVPSECGGERGYRGHSFLSVPITYAAPGTGRPLCRRHEPDRSDRRGPLYTRRSEAGRVRSPTRSAPRSRMRGWLNGTHSSSGCSESSSWRMIFSSSSCPHPLCCTAMRRWRPDACRPIRWAATSTPSAGWGRAGSA